jgi:hypothetical protein
MAGMPASASAVARAAERRARWGVALGKRLLRKAERWKALSVACLLTLAACAPGRQGPQMQPLNEALVVLEGATDLRVLDEGLGVQYELEVSYPAEAPLAILRAVLSDKRWTPLLKDPLNPAIETAHARGWTRFIDGTADPAVRVHQWSGDWVSVDGDVVRYQLQYRSSESAADVPTSDRLRVLARFSSSAELKKLGVVVAPDAK